MILFPHILSRVGGLDLEQIDNLSFGKMEDVNMLLSNYERINVEINKANDLFQFTFQNLKDYRLKRYLVNAQKDFKRKNFSFIKKLKKYNASSEDEILINKLLEEISSLQGLLLINENDLNHFQTTFELEKNTHLSNLQKITRQENFQKATLQSSQSFWIRLQRFNKKSVSDFRKKEKQTARSAAQYVYRTATKTSPFSHFTTLELLSLEDGIFGKSKVKLSSSVIEYNGILLRKIKALLLENIDLSRQLKVKLNPSIQYEQEEILFLKNENNIDTLQRLEQSDILELVGRNLREDGIYFWQLILELEKEVDAEAEELEDYLLQIIETGYLEWVWDFKDSGFDWEKEVHDWLSRLPDFEGKEKWMNLFEKLNLSKKVYLLGDTKTRKLIQNDLKENLEKIGIQQVQSELIFFEDVRSSSDSQIAEKEITPVVASLNALLNTLEPLTFDEIKAQIKRVWENKFSKKDSIPFLLFYEEFYKTDFSEISFYNKNQTELIDFLKSNLKGLAHYKGENDLNFSSEDLQKFFKKTSNRPDQSYSGLFQFYKSGDQWKAIINGLTPGYGKLFGRFLPLFDKEITRELQNWNEDLQGEKMWLENIDTSYFNANFHPPLLKNEIQSPNGLQKLKKDFQISISDIEVQWDEKQQSPILIFSKNKEEISIFDFGFEHPSNRSPLFQLLNGYSLPKATFRIFVNFVNEIFAIKDKNEIISFPRISIDNRLILQRKRQQLPKSFFPKKEKQEAEATYFLRIQQWKKDRNLPRFIFVKPIFNPNDKVEDFNRDFYKPQFIDLNSPLAIKLLQRIVEKHQGAINLEEMLPQPSQVGYSNKVREEVIQWKNF